MSAATGDHTDTPRDVAVVLVLTTVPVGEPGEVIARRLVEDRLAACVNVLAPMTSFYRWKNRVERGDERQLLIKTTAHHVAAVQALIGELHPYDLPEFVVIGPVEGSPAYLDWLRGST